MASNIWTRAARTTGLMFGVVFFFETIIVAFMYYAMSPEELAKQIFWQPLAGLVIFVFSFVYFSEVSNEKYREKDIAKELEKRLNNYDPTVAVDEDMKMSYYRLRSKPLTGGDWIVEKVGTLLEMDEAMRAYLNMPVPQQDRILRISRIEETLLVTNTIYNLPRDA